MSGVFVLTVHPTSGVRQAYTVPPLPPSGPFFSFASLIHNKQNCSDAESKAWAPMVLHLPHAEGVFGVTFNDVTKDAAFYASTARFVSCLSHCPRQSWE
jgi:hypothetical protein